MLRPRYPIRMAGPKPIYRHKSVIYCCYNDIVFFLSSDEYALVSKRKDTVLLPFDRPFKGGEKHELVAFDRTVLERVVLFQWPAELGCWVPDPDPDHLACDTPMI